MITKWLKSKLRTERIVLDVALIYTLKYFYHRLRFRPADQKMLFIVGCQRSGTSLMNRIFTRDLSVSVYRESSELSSQDLLNKLRLNSLADMQKTLSKNKANLIVLKPLVESQNILQLLQNFPNSKALWMYRDYQDVAQSNLKRFGTRNGINDLYPIVENHPQDWRSEKASDYVREMVRQHFSASMNPQDASALFWFARNQLFYELQLDQNPRVLLCRYEDLTHHPESTMQQIYQFLDMDAKPTNLGREVTTESVGKGNQTAISPQIAELCDELLQRLQQSSQKQTAATAGLVESAVQTQ